MENEYSSLITGNNYSIYTSDKRYLEVGEDQKVNVKPKFPKGFQHTTVTTGLEGTMMVLNFTIDQELLKLFSSGTVTIDGVKGTRSVTSLCDPITVDNRNHTIEIRWSRDIIEILYANKIEKSEEPEPLPESTVTAVFTIGDTGLKAGPQTEIKIGNTINDTIPFTRILVDGEYELDLEEDITIDGVGIYYDFKTEGEHTVDYVLANPAALGPGMFSGCNNMTSIVIPDTVTSINEYALLIRCPIIFKNTIPATLLDSNHTFSKGAVVMVPEEAYDTYLTAWGEIDIKIFPGDTISSITCTIRTDGNNTQIAFLGEREESPFISIMWYKDPNLVDISERTSINNGYLEFGDFGDPGTQTLIYNFPGTKVFDGIFKGTEIGKILEISDTITEIGDFAFFDTSVYEVTIPATVTSIESKAFPATKVHMLGTVPPQIESDSFATNATIYVPEGYVSTYQTAYSSFSYTILEEQPVVDTKVTCTYHVAYGSENIKIASCPDGYPIPFRDIVLNKHSILSDVSISGKDIIYYFENSGDYNIDFILEDPGIVPEHAFQMCDAITKVKLNEHITEISYSAFKCKLNDITIPSSITYIGDVAFSECATIFMEGTVPPQLGGKDAFYGYATIFVPNEALSTYKTAYSEYPYTILPIEGTGWTPSEPISITSEEFESSVSSGELNVSYFYYIIDIYKDNLVIITGISGGSNEYLPFNLENSMTQDNFDFLVGKSALKADDVYYTTDTEKVFLATSTSTYDEIERESPSPEPKGTGWTPSDPIDVTGTELEDLLTGGAKGPKAGQGNANPGYFYNVTEASLEFSVGLYVALNESEVTTFDINNSMTQAEFDLLVNGGGLSKGTVYYLTDSEEVCIATSTTTSQEIEREEPSPEASYVIEDITEEEIQDVESWWTVTFAVAVDNSGMLSFSTEDDLSLYNKMHYSLSNSIKQEIVSDSFVSVPVSVYTMTGLKDGIYKLILSGNYTDKESVDHSVFRVFEITKITKSIK